MNRRTTVPATRSAVSSRAPASSVSLASRPFSGPALHEAGSIPAASPGSGRLGHDFGKVAVHRPAAPAQGAPVQLEAAPIQRVTEESSGVLAALRPQQPRQFEFPSKDRWQAEREEMDRQAHEHVQKTLAETGMLPKEEMIRRHDPKYAAARDAEEARIRDQASLERYQRDERERRTQQRIAPYLRQARKRRRIEEKTAAIRSEFPEALHLRKTRRPEDELKYVLRPRRQQAQDPRNRQKRQNVEGNYWHATSTVREGLPLQQYDAFASSGLLISARGAEMGGWAKRDMGLPTKNVPRNQYPANFPPHATLGSHGKTLGDMGAVKAKLKEMKDRVHGVSPDQSTNGRPRQGGFSRMDFGDGFLEDVAPKAPYRDAQSIPYNEAQIHYKPEHILGVHTEVDPNVTEANPDPAKPLVDAMQMQDSLSSEFEVDVPIVEYHLGQITTHQSRVAFLESVRQRHPDIFEKLPSSYRSLLDKEDQKKK